MILTERKRERVGGAERVTDSEGQRARQEKERKGRGTQRDTKKRSHHIENEQSSINSNLYVSDDGYP